jgi:hypothetical protein
MNATHILYKAAGSPVMEGDTPGTCRSCGEESIGTPFEEWVRDTFNDRNRMMPGDIICQACQFSFDVKSPTLTAKVGKDKLQRMTNYTHIVQAGVWYALSKGEKARMVELLTRPCELVVIAVSGQKHLIFKAQPGWWQIEEQAVRPFPDQLSIIMALVEQLYNGGISKTEIETGRYSQRRILDYGLERWRELEQAVKPLRGSVALNLALFLAQKEDTEDGNTRTSEDVVTPALEGSPGGVQGKVRPQHLATVRGSGTQRRIHQQPEQVHQYDLFAATDHDPEGGR